MTPTKPPTKAALAKMETGFRSIHADFTSSHGYRWPYPGNWAHAPGPIRTNNSDACPDSIGDGVCAARSWSGAASGGIPANVVLVVHWKKTDLLGSSIDKVRLRKAWVSDVLDVPLLARSGFLGPINGIGHNLYCADLSCANLYCADLSYADLRSANLSYATYTQGTLFPADLDPKACGMKLVAY